MKKLFEIKLSLRQVIFGIFVFALLSGINWVGHHTMVSSSTQTTEYYSYMTVMNPLGSDSRWASGIIRDDEWYVAESGWEFHYAFAYTQDHINWTILIDLDLEHFEADGDWVEYPYTNLDTNFGYITDDISYYFRQ